MTTLAAGRWVTAYLAVGESVSVVGSGPALLRIVTRQTTRNRSFGNRLWSRDFGPFSGGAVVTLDCTVGPSTLDTAANLIVGNFPPVNSDGRADGVRWIAVENDRPGEFTRGTSYIKSGGIYIPDGSVGSTLWNNDDEWLNAETWAN